MSADSSTLESVVGAILHAAPDAIILTDEQNQIIEFNTAAARIFGYLKEEALNRSLSELIIAPVFQPLYEVNRQQQAASMGDVSHNRRLELNGVRKDGAVFPMELTMFPINTPAGLLFVLYIRDITSQQKSDMVLRRTGARLKNVVANLQGGVILANEDHRIELVNAELCNMFYLPVTPEALTGRSSADLRADIQRLVVDPEGFQERIRAIVSLRELALNDIIHCHDGRVLSRDYIPIMHEDVYLGYLTRFRDVTKEFETRKRWEQLLNLEELNKEIIRLFLQMDDTDDAIQQALALVGPLLDVSRAYVFRFREGERMVDNTHEWCAPGIKSEIDNLKGILPDDVLPSLVPMLTRDRIIAPYHISSLPQDLRNFSEPQGVESALLLPLYSDGRLEGFIGCVENRCPRAWLPEEIASFRLVAESYARALERQRTQRDLIEARDSALRTAQVRSQFVANMSHEIRTPMTGVMGMLELLLESPLDDEQREFAEESFNSASRLLNILNDILDFSKLDAGFVVLEAETITLADIASEVRSTILMQRRHPTVDIRIDIAPDVPAQVKGDPTRLRQVLTNLLGNAVKFTHEGYVLLQMRLAGFQAGQAKIRFEVIDTGIGITPEHLEFIFDSFNQVDSSVTRKYGGTGLGLSITHQLIELMGGQIEVESQVGQGSTFRFALTMPAIASSQAPSALVDKQAFEQLRILVIDDDRTSRYVFTQQLESFGIGITALSWDHVSLLLAEAHTGDIVPYDLIFIYASAHADGQIPGLAVKQLRPLTHTQSDSRVITLVNAGAGDEIQANQLRRPVHQSDLHNILISAAASVSDASRPASSPKAGDSQQTAVPVRRILLVEDYPLNARLVAEGLARDHLAVDIVENGLEALEQLQQVEYDLILMDMQMPVMTGLEATQHIRESDTPYRNIPILALTASAMPDQRASYIQAGVNEVITKPYVLGSLRDLVNEWLEHEWRENGE